MMTKSRLIESKCASLEAQLFEERHCRVVPPPSCSIEDVIRAYEILDLLDKPFPNRQEANPQCHAIQHVLDGLILGGDE